jgi:hypothetical protein
MVLGGGISVGAALLKRATVRARPLMTLRPLGMLGDTRHPMHRIVHRVQHVVLSRHGLHLSFGSWFSTTDRDSISLIE